MPDPFTQLAHDGLGASVYDPAQDEPARAQYHAISLASARQHIAILDGATNARGETLRVMPGYIDLMTPNAVADQVQGVHLTGMYQALLPTLIEFSLFAFTQAHVFPEIGDAKSELSPQPAGGRAPGLLLLERTLSGAAVQRDEDQHRVPRDAIRHAVAVYTALLMARYVWLHELAHCAKGHVSFIKGTGIALRLYEVEDGAASLVTPRTNPKINEQARLNILRLMEYDADETAFLGLCRIQLQQGENIEGIKVLDLPLRLGLSVFAAYGATWLFEEYQNFMNSHHGRSHPAPYDRLRGITCTALQSLGPQVDGFADLHRAVAASFNALSASIPTMFQVEAVGSQAQDIAFSAGARAALADGLKPYAFV